jgi:hypothetical protein
MLKAEILPINSLGPLKMKGFRAVDGKSLMRQICPSTND